MSISALIIGYGSIGQRHARIIDSMENIERVSVLSNKKNIPFHKIKSMQEITKLNPDYIIIASPTSIHYEQLVFLEKNIKNKIILVEKPLFDKVFDFLPVNNSVWVAYMFRFHPILQIIKKEVSNKLIWNVHIFCGSYLPDWRSGRDYRKTYSAIKEHGGGVLLDLSHELDYLQWLFGRIEIDYVINEKISSLEITSDDFLSLNGHNNNNVKFQINLNYFTRKAIRKIIIDGEDISLQADFIKNRATLISEGKTKKFDFSDTSIDEIYRKEHASILNNDLENACSYDDGVKTMKLIEDIRNFEIK